MTLDEAKTIIDLVEKRIVIDTSELDGMSLEELIAWMLDESRTGPDFIVGWIKSAGLMQNSDGTINGPKVRSFVATGLSIEVVTVCNTARKMVADEQRRNMK